MANLLSTAISVGNAVTAADSIDVSGSDLTNAGISAALSAATALSAGQGLGGAASAALGAGLGSIPGASTIASAVGDVGGLLGLGGIAGIGGLSGTKPGALHTEFATGPASWSKPYGAGTDIIFYLQRADGGGAESTGEAAVGGDLGGFSDVASAAVSDASAAAGFGDMAGLANGLSEGIVPSDVMAGIGLPDGMSSAMNQVASAASMAGSLGSIAGITVPSLAGPMTGITEGLSMAGDLYTSAAAAISNPSIENITAAVGATTVATDALGVTSGLNDTVNNSYAASQAFFSETLSNSFNTDIDTSGYVVPLEAAPVSEFSTSMATMTGAVTSTTDFVAGINNGSYGYTSPAAEAEMNRTNPQGKPSKS